MKSREFPGLTDLETEYVRLSLAAAKPWRNTPEYEEIKAEALFASFQGIDEERDSGKNLKSVAFVSAQSAIKNFWRYQGRQKRNAETLQLESLCGASDEPRIPDFADEVIERVSLEQQLRSLCSEFQLRVLHRMYVEQWTAEEIAAAEGLTTKRIRNTIYNTTHKLRCKMDVQ